MKKDTNKEIKAIYELLYARYGPQNWWPANTAFEVIVGAILTQNTSWNNVEKAIRNLKNNGLLIPRLLYDIKIETLADAIKPCGFYNLKSHRLKNFLHYFVKSHNGSITNLKRIPTKKLRSELLSINGIGEETADCILLYAAEKPVFVVDKYTKRLLERHNVISKKYNYDEMQNIFHCALKKEVQTFNEYHALIVKVSKEHCKTKANCNGCPLESLLKGGKN